MGSNTTDGFGIGSTSLIETLKTVGSTRTFNAGETVLFQGEADQRVLYILSGTANILSLTAEGDVTWLGKARAGHFLGDAAFLSGSAPDYEVIVATPMRVVSVTRSALEALLIRDPALYADIAHSLATKFNHLTNQYIEAVCLSAVGRVCAELVRLASPIGIDPGKLVIRPIPVFTDLGGQLGTTRETVSRTVSDLQKKGILRRTPGAIIVEKPAVLKASIK